MGGDGGGRAGHGDMAWGGGPGTMAEMAGKVKEKILRNVGTARAWDCLGAASAGLLRRGLDGIEETACDPERTFVTPIGPPGAGRGQNTYRPRD